MTNEISVHDEPKLLSELISSLGQASGAASQLLHMLRDPRWFIIRDCISLSQEGVVGLATFQASKISAVKS